MRRNWLAMSLIAPLGALAIGIGAGPAALASRSAGRGHLAGEHRSAPSSSAPSGTLVISNETGSLWTCGFNPFQGGVLGNGVATPIYEPLVYVDTLESGKTTPMLATSYSWSDGNKVLTFTIRKGVKFSDGTPLTAADVVFTFQLMKKWPALDLTSVWSVLQSVVQQGDKVVLTFKTTAVPYFYYVADQVFIVPEHVWATVKNPVTYADTDPIGTGPFTVQSCSGQSITFAANPHYWQPGEPKIAKVIYPAFTSNQPANTELATGQATWGGQFIPSIKSFYESKSPNNHYWFPPVANVSLFLNEKVPPLNDVAVRQAMAFAVDRARVSAIGEYGYEPPANQTGIVTPTFKSWLDPSLQAKYGYRYDPARAISILEKDGYKKGPGGVFEKDGKQLSFSVINVGGNSDWVASLQIVQHDLAAVGIKITVDNLAGTDFDSDLYTGRFQLAYDNEFGGPTPYYELRQLLYSGNTAPIGKIAATNYERYSNPAVDKLINAYATTTSAAAQHQIVDQLENVMLSQVPVIPMTESVDWYQYNTSSFTGWVTPSDPYAQPAPYNYPDNEQILLHLQPK